MFLHWERVEGIGPLQPTSPILFPGSNLLLASFSYFFFPACRVGFQQRSALDSREELCQIYVYEAWKSDAETTLQSVLRLNAGYAPSVGAQKTDIVREEVFYPPRGCHCQYSVPGPKRRKARGGSGGLGAWGLGVPAGISKPPEDF